MYLDLRIGSKGRIQMNPLRWFLLVLGIIGIALIVFRLVNGLGVSSNLSDEWPWGLWIYMDLVVIALAGCGFALAILTFVFQVHAFENFARQTLLISFLLYVFALLLLFVEIGRWDNFYWIFVSFAITSPLYEVAMCIAVYFILQAYELFNTWLERFYPKGEFWRPIIKWLLPLILFLACIVPFGHQASLGGLYLAMPTKLNVIWSSQFLPWGCLMSALFGGICFFAVINRATALRYKDECDTFNLRKLLKIAGVLMWVYLIIKIVEMSVRGAWAEVFSGSNEGVLFMVEIIVGVLIPAALIFTKASACSKGQVAIGLLATFGVCLNRYNFIFAGMRDYVGVDYMPNLVETGIVIGVGALMVLVYILCLENVPVYRMGKNDMHEVAILPEDKE